MSPGAAPKPPLMQRTLVVLFSVAMVLISGYMLRKDVKHRSDKIANKSESKERLLNELEGQVDVARASVSTEYLKEVVDNQKLREQTEKGINPEIRKGLKDQALDLLNRITPSKADGKTDDKVDGKVDDAATK